MIVEYATGTVHRFVERLADPRLVLTACDKRVHAPSGPIVLCPCDYHKPLVAPTLPSNQHGCPVCFPDGTGWHAVRISYMAEPAPPWPPTTLVDGS